MIRLRTLTVVSIIIILIGFISVLVLNMEKDKKIIIKQRLFGKLTML